MSKVDNIVPANICTHCTLVEYVKYYNTFLSRNESYGEQYENWQYNRWKINYDENCKAVEEIFLSGFDRGSSTKPVFLFKNTRHQSIDIS